MGVIPGARAVVVKYAPMGDPMELRIHGYELTLRLADAEKIEIDESTIREASENQEAENCISGLYSMQARAANAGKTAVAQGKVNGQKARGLRGEVNTPGSEKKDGIMSRQTLRPLPEENRSLLPWRETRTAERLLSSIS